MRRKNVLLIICDQLIRDVLGLYGGKICQTPEIDKSFRNSVVFSNAYTTISLCSPARASIFTGKLPNKHGVLYNVTTNKYGRPELENKEDMITNFLHEEGYRCGYVGKWHIGRKKGPREYGFQGTKFAGYGIPLEFCDDYDGYLREKGHPGMRKVKIKKVSSDKNIDEAFLPLYESSPGTSFNSGVIDLPTDLTPEGFVANRTIDLIRKFKKERFFITAAFWGPHAPFLPSSEFAGRHNPESIRKWRNFRDELINKPRIQKRYAELFNRNLTNAHWSVWQKLIAANFDFMNMIDYQIGRILGELKQLNLEKDTIVIFTSDHGDTLGCHGGQWDKGPYMYEETYTVPLLVRCPDFHNRRNIRSLVSNMDIFSTVLDIAGVPVPDGVDSKSLLPLIKGDKNPIRDCIVSQFYGFDARGLNLQEMVRMGNYKYVFNPSDIDEFYDLKHDPAEMYNLINKPQLKKTIRKFKLKLFKEMKNGNDPFADCGYQLMGL